MSEEDSCKINEELPKDFKTQAFIDQLKSISDSNLIDMYGQLIGRGYLAKFQMRIEDEKFHLKQAIHVKRELSNRLGQRFYRNAMEF